MNKDNINLKQYFKNAKFYKFQKVFKILSFILIELTCIAFTILFIFNLVDIIFLGFAVSFFVRLPFNYFRNFDFLTNVIYFGLTKDADKKLVVYHFMSMGGVVLANIGIALLFQTYTYPIFAVIAILSLFSIVTLVYLDWITYNNAKGLIDIDKNLYKDLTD